MAPGFSLLLGMQQDDDWVIPFVSGMQQKLRTQDFVWLFARHFEQIIIRLSTVTTRREQWWPLVTAIHDKDDGVRLWERVWYFVSGTHLRYDCTHSCHVCFGLARSWTQIDYLQSAVVLEAFLQSCRYRWGKLWLHSFSASDTYWLPF